MAYNREIFLKVKAKLKLNDEALRRRIQRLADSNSITTEAALFAVAKEINIKVNKHTKKRPDILEELRTLRQDNQSEIIKPHKAYVQRTVSHVTEVGCFEATPPYITNKMISEMAANTKAYQFVYLFENSIRSFIDHVLTFKHGKNWWDTTHYADDLRSKVNDLKKSDQDCPWASRKAPHPLYFLNLSDLSTIVQKAKKIFNGYFDNIGENVNAGWLQGLIADVNKPRRIIGHNNPITDGLFKICETDITKWLGQLKYISKNKFPESAIIQQ